MTIASVDPQTIRTLTIQNLGLPSSTGLESMEALSELVRRAASFVAPCTSARLRSSIVRGLVGLGEQEFFKDAIDGVIDTLVIYGDLIEVRDGESDAVLLYPAPPTFVHRGDFVYLVGGGPLSLDGLPASLLHAIERVRQLRRIHDPDGQISAELNELGLSELAETLWLKRPAQRSAADIIQRVQLELARCESRGEVPGLRILDPERPPTGFYTDRWTQPTKRTGCFVARRDQKYGAALWCVVEIADGRVTHLLDLPQEDWRGCDEAWRLQCAFDAQRGTPQRYRVRQESDAHRVLVDFFSPIPLWARRMWDVVGEPIPPRKCLLSYSLPRRTFEHERKDVLHDLLWLAPAE